MGNCLQILGVLFLAESFYSSTLPSKLQLLHLSKNLVMFPPRVIWVLATSTTKKINIEPLANQFPLIFFIFRDNYHSLLIKYFENHCFTIHIVRFHNLYCVFILMISSRRSHLFSQSTLPVIVKAQFSFTMRNFQLCPGLIYLYLSPQY